MKTKMIAILLTAALTICLTACSGQAPSSDLPQNSASDSAPPTVELFYGRVNQVAGNELTLDLAKLPGDDTADSAPQDEDGEMPATVMTPATEAGAAEGGQTGAEERTELEYTGESKDFVIPGGLKISGANGEEKQLSDIKKGSILGVFTGEDGLVTEVVLYE